MKDYFLFAVAFLSTFAALFSLFPPHSEANAFPRKFHVEGNAIVDGAGMEVVFRGLDPVDPVIQAFASMTAAFADPSYLPWSEEHARKMYEWGAKIMRLPVHPAVWRVHGEDSCLRILDRSIEEAARLGLYVIIDYHSIGYPPTGEYEAIGPYYGGGELYQTTENEIRAFWATVSARYSSNDVVAFYEIFNEPVYPGFTRGADPAYGSPAAWIVWKELAEEIIDVIRGNDPDSVILVGGLDWAYDISFAADYPVERPNIVYATHPYPDSNWYKSWDEAFGIIKEKYPVFATELGFEADGEKSEDKYTGPGRYRDAIESYLESKGISWTAWCFSRSWTPALLRGDSYAPTEPGRFFRRWLSEYGGVEPLPDLKINGSDGPLTVKRGETVSITASLMPGKEYYNYAEAWLIADTPFGTYCYKAANRAGSWRPGSLPAYRGPLADLPPLEVANSGALPPGAYTVRFEIRSGGGAGRTYSDTAVFSVN